MWVASDDVDLGSPLLLNWYGTATDIKYEKAVKVSNDSGVPTRVARLTYVDLSDFTVNGLLDRVERGNIYPWMIFCEE